MYTIENPTSQEKLQSIKFENGNNADVFMSDKDINNIPTRVIQNITSNNGSTIADTIKNQMFSDTISSNNNRQQLAVNTNYVNKSEVNKAARQLGADTDEQNNLVIVKKPKTVKNVDTTKGAFIAYEAIKSGMSEEDLNNNFKSYGFNNEDIVDVNKRLGVINKAIKNGMNLDEIKKRMSNSVINSEIKHKIKEENNDFKELTASELVSSLKILKPVMTSDAMTTLPAFFGNKAAQQRYDNARTNSRNRIIEIAKKDYNLDLIWQGGGVGEEGWYAKTKEGLVEVTPSFLQDIAKESGEIIGGTAGAIAGGVYGARAGGTFGASIGSAIPGIGTAAGGTIGTTLGAAGGALVGGISGAIAGDNLDYLVQAMKINQDMEAEAIAYRSLNAMEIAAVGEVIGYAAFKSLGAGWKSIVNAKNYILKGNDAAASKALKEVFSLTDEEVTDITNQFLTYNESSGNNVSDSINAVVNSVKGTTDLIEKANTLNPSVTANMSKQVFNRSENLLNRINELSPTEAPRFFINDLVNYTSDVKKQYANVKAIAAESSKNSDFVWDYNKLAIVPSLEDLSSKITNPAVKERFLLQLDRVRALTIGKAKRKSVLSELSGDKGKAERIIVQADKKRGFADLLELRQLTNDFLYNKNITKYDDKQAVRNILDNIDNMIDEAAPKVVDNGKQWLKDWYKARYDYSKMKQTEKSAMYKVLFDKNGSVKPVQPDTVVKAMSKYITALDGSFDDIMSKLPKESRNMYENTVLNHLANKSSVKDGNVAAINFYELSEELNKINFTDANARAIKSMVNEYSEVFKNDIAIGTMSTRLNVPIFKSYLTDNPVIRLKFEAASTAFNSIRSKLPTKSGRASALIKKSAEVLENPLKQKPFKELLEEFKYEPETLKALNDLRQQAAKEAAEGLDKSANLVNVYEGGKLNGKIIIAKIPKHRIITLDQAKVIADTEAITLDSKSLKDTLVKYGYKAIINSNDRINLIGK